MCRFRIREIKTKAEVLCTNQFNLKNIIEDIALLHYYDSKEPARNVKYEVYDTKTNKVVYSELEEIKN